LACSGRLAGPCRAFAAVAKGDVFNVTLTLRIVVAMHCRAAP
jgi:hypothetical protein